MIPIKNVYYMLSYAFQVLNEQNYKNIATEQFHNTAELMAAILEKGIKVQLKRGLCKEYIPQVAALTSHTTGTFVAHQKNPSVLCVHLLVFVTVL